MRLRLHSRECGRPYFVIDLTLQLTSNWEHKLTRDINQYYKLQIMWFMIGKIAICWRYAHDVDPDTYYYFENVVT